MREFKLKYILVFCFVILASIFGCAYKDKVNIYTGIDSKEEYERLTSSSTTEMYVLFDDNGLAVEDELEDVTTKDKNNETSSIPDISYEKEAYSDTVTSNNKAGQSENISEEPDTSLTNEAAKDTGIISVDEKNTEKEANLSKDNKTIKDTSSAEHAKIENENKHNNALNTSYDATDVYVLNKNTKKFHSPSCGSAKQIKEKNKGSGNDRASIIAQGYQPCKRCNP